MLPQERKEEIQRRLALELEHSKMTQSRAATLLGISPVYFSKIKDKFQWKSIPETIWRRWNRWEESGSSFMEYAEDCGTEDNPIQVIPKTNGEVEPKKAAAEVAEAPIPPVPKLKSVSTLLTSDVDLRINGMEPTRDPELIQQRIDKLMMAAGQPIKERDCLEVIAENIEMLKAQGYIVEFSLKLPA
jgi:hypothetical protein